MTATDTIVALASGRGAAGVAVIRASGGDVQRILGAMVGGVPKPRVASFRTLRSLKSGEAIDQGLVLFFKGPHSFTGEDVGEFHLHGGVAIIDRVLGELCERDGVRLAQPGEFTRRAFENGKLDLTAAEAIADLVNAETEAQRAQALRQLQGELGALYEYWRAELISLLALLEAEIDFPDEDLPGGLSALVHPRMAALIAALEQHLSDGKTGERVRDGVTIAIVGPPNVGKSSLLNRLARREAAIVSTIPGTTRDIVEVRLVLSGVPVWIADTAGLRETDDEVESEGVRRALARAEQADIVLLVDAEPVSALRDQGARQKVLRVYNKCDLAAGLNEAEISSDAAAIHVSAKTGQGIATLELALGEIVAGLVARTEAPTLTRARHRNGVERTLTSLRHAVLANNEGPELLAEDIRLAARALGEITGRVSVDDVLDRVFAEFCIGK